MVYLEPAFPKKPYSERQAVAIYQRYQHVSSTSKHASRAQPPWSSSTPMPDQAYIRPSLDTLIGYFVDSKKALNKGEDIARANDLITEARNNFLIIGEYTTQHHFQLSELCRQHDACRELHAALGEVIQTCESDFKSLIAHLDDLHGRVSAEIRQLEEVPSMAELADAGSAKKTLKDFIDIDGLQELDKDFMDTIDLTNEAIDHVTKVYEDFGEELDAIDQDIAVASKYYHRATFLDAGKTFADLDEKAHTISSDVRALVSHYDLCLTALKHIDGAGDAVANVGLDMDQMQTMTPVRPPETREDLDHMLQVLVGDAVEIDEVVKEIADFLADIDQGARGIADLRVDLQQQQRNQSAAARAIGDVNNRMPLIIQSALDCHQRWAQLRDRFEEKIVDLSSLESFYQEYLTSFKHLLGEMQRRAEARAAISNLVEDAQNELQKAFQVEVKERQAFATDFGRHLPSDLWELLGGNDLPSEFEVTMMKAENGKMADTPADVWKDAQRKLSKLRREPR